MARTLVDGLQVDHAADICRRDRALELIADMERLDGQIKASVARLSREVNASNTILLEIMGCGQITAAMIISRVRNVDRSPTGTTSLATTAPPPSRHPPESDAGTG